MNNEFPVAGEEVGGHANTSALLFPMYVHSSTGSLELAGDREHNPATVVGFESLYRKADAGQTLLETLTKTASKKWSKCSAKRLLSKNFPTISTLRSYKLREYLPNDVVAGLTVGITMIPQGMAFASLSTLPPIVGLYISFFASLAYFVLGTAHQLSWGCVAVLSILMGNILDKYEVKVKANLGILDNGTDSVTSTLQPLMNASDMSGILNTTAALSDTLSSQVPDALSIQKKIEVAGAVTMISGIILAVLGKLGLGRVTSFMSDSLITSFTVGVSFHVVSSQIKTALGLEFPRQSGIFKLIRLWVVMLSNIHHTNLATAIISLLCLATLYIVKRFINEKYKTKLRVPVPIELFVVIVATLVTAYTRLSEEYSVSIVKEIPVGVPQPRIPDLSLGTDYLMDGLVIIIVSFTQNVAMAKLMALKHNYRINSNQEMFACGMVSVVCSVFSGYISGPSVSRSLVQDGAGGKTQVASLFAAALVFLVIILIGPYFYYLPKCVLAAIIIVNLRSMFLKMATVPALWRKSPVDALVWIITCAATAFLETDIGLLVGIVTCIVFVLIRSQVATVDVVSEICAGDLHVWRSGDRYVGGKVTGSVKVVRINSALYFANAEIVADRVFKKTGANPIKMKKGTSVTIKASADGVQKNLSIKPETPLINSAMREDGPPAEQSATLSQVSVNHRLSAKAVPDPCTHSVPSDALPFSHLVVDLSPVSFVDVMGVAALEFLITKYQAVGISVYFANAQEKCLDTLEKTEFLKKHGDLVFVTTDAAVRHALAVHRV